MDNFNSAYAAYYDLLNQDKNYSSEAGFVAKRIKAVFPHAETLLDIGCGTGKHDVKLAECGFQVCGIDRSEEMIKIAKRYETSTLRFFCQDALQLHFSGKFDCVVSLFHVMSYMTEPEMLKTCFQNAYDALVSRGVFLFDFWYGPAVLKQRPEKRVRVMENEDFHVERTAVPKWDEKKHLVEVIYDICVQNRKNGEIYSFREEHPMRYFFQPELQEILLSIGFSNVRFEEFLSGEKADEDTWGVCCIAEKQIPSGAKP